MRERVTPFFLDSEDDNIIFREFDDYPPFHTMDMEDDNLKDAFLSLAKGEMEAIVSEHHGGIIGYAFKGHAEDIATILNLHYKERVR